MRYLRGCGQCVGVSESDCTCSPPSSFLEIGVLAIDRVDFLSGVAGLAADAVLVLVVLRTGVGGLAAGLIEFGTCFLGVVVDCGRTTFVETW